MRKENIGPNHYLGKLVSEIIYEKYLPTTNVDTLPSKHTVNVTPDEKAEADRLHNILNATYDDGTKPSTKYGIKESTSIAHKNWINHIDSLAKIYLPKKLQCRFDKIVVTNIIEFKEGLSDYLWDTDLSWYRVEDDFWVNTTKHSWYSEVILTRTE